MNNTAADTALCPWQGTTGEMEKSVQMNQCTGSTDMAGPAAIH